MKGIATTVLIADDDADSRAIARALLEFQGRAVVEAVDGSECLRAARRLRPDVLVLDLVMPGYDGWYVASTLRADPLCRRIPILAVTAAVLPGDRERALRSGCDRVLLKPISPLELAVEIDALFQRSLTRPAPGDRLPARPDPLRDTRAGRAAQAPW
jgi:two-component system cell cycle response regulator DivK